MRVSLAIRQAPSHAVFADQIEFGGSEQTFELLGARAAEGVPVLGLDCGKQRKRIRLPAM